MVVGTSYGAVLAAAVERSEECVLYPVDSSLVNILIGEDDDSGVEASFVRASSHRGLLLQTSNLDHGSTPVVGMR